MLSRLERSKSPLDIFYKRDEITLFFLFEAFQVKIQDKYLNDLCIIINIFRQNFAIQKQPICWYLDDGTLYLKWDNQNLYKNVQFHCSCKKYN